MDSEEEVIPTVDSLDEEIAHDIQTEDKKIDDYNETEAHSAVDDEDSTKAEPPAAAIDPQLEVPSSQQLLEVQNIATESIIEIPEKIEDVTIQKEVSATNLVNETVEVSDVTTHSDLTEVGDFDEKTLPQSEEAPSQDVVQVLSEQNIENGIQDNQNQESAELIVETGETTGKPPESKLQVEEKKSDKLDTSSKDMISSVEDSNKSVGQNEVKDTGSEKPSQEPPRKKSRNTSLSSYYRRSTSRSLSGKGSSVVELPDDFYYDIEDFQSNSSVTDESGIPPNILQFYHSFGYDCRKRSNLHLLPGPTLLLAAGNLVHPTRSFFAVAEKGIKPHILIYEYPSLRLYRILRDGTETAYSSIDFNPKGNLLASVGSQPDYMLTVWNWKKEKIMLRLKAFSQEIFRVTFSPEQEGYLTTSGTSHIRFWRMARTFTGLKLKGALGRFGKTALSDIEGYIQLPDGKVLSGSDWGNMLLWDGGLIKVEISRKNQKPCHVGSIQQLVMDEGELITIGLDGFVRVWEMEAIDSADTTDDYDIFEIEPMNQLKIGNDVQLTCMAKANIDEDHDGEDGSSIWYAQDANGVIWKLDLSFSHTTKSPEKLFSYTAGAITSASSSPSCHLVASTGDAFIRIHDYLQKSLLCQYFAPTPNTIGTFVIWPEANVDPTGRQILAGFSDGIMRVLELQEVDGISQLILRQALKPHSSSITGIAIDSKGMLLATGSTDCTVFFFGVHKEQLNPLGFISIPGQVTGMEWSPHEFSRSTLLVSCSNGKVLEVSSPNPSSINNTSSYKLNDLDIKSYTFQSIKSRLRRDEETERIEMEKANRRKERENELKRKKERGEEISEEEAQAFLDEDPNAEKEKEEEPLYFPPEPNSVLQAFYLTPGRFCVSMDGFDAGYLYECEFPKKKRLMNQPLEPKRAVAVEDSDDAPMTSIKFTKDRHKLVVGFKHGLIRVYPLDDDPNAPFHIDELRHHWDLNMHDNDTGAVTAITESHDGAYMLTVGADGNMYGYISLSHEVIAKSMEGKCAELPDIETFPPSGISVDDIDDPQAYSIEDAKLKSENDKMIRDAEAKKLLERKKINKLRKVFLDLLHQNNALPESVQLPRKEFELNPALNKQIRTETHNRIERVKIEMKWEKEKLALAHSKLKTRFRSQVDCDRIVVHAFNSNHSVSSFRVSKLSEEYYDLLERVEERMRAASLTSEKGGVIVSKDSTETPVPSQQSAESSETLVEDDKSYLNEAKFRKKSSILQGRKAEQVAKALQRAADLKTKRDKRQEEWDELHRKKPDEFYEDPVDVAMIQEAQANMGDFKLKTSPDYVVPEHLRMDTEKKRHQILTLQGLVNQAKLNFNGELRSLRDEKFKMIKELNVKVDDLKRLQENMKEEEVMSLPYLPENHPDEEPHRKYEYTKESLLAFEKDERQRENESKMQKGGGGLFQGLTVEQTEGIVKSEREFHRKRNSSVATSDDMKFVETPPVQEVVPPTEFELQLVQIERIRVKYERDRLLHLIGDRMTLFDAELRLLLHTKQQLDVDLKMANLREVTLIEELLLLKEYEKREQALSGRVTCKKNELSEINGKAAEMQVKLETKRRDIERLTEKEKALYTTFTASLGDNNKFSDFLNKVFKKKIKRSKKKVAVEGQDEDSEVSSSEESDWSSDEDEDDSIEGVFDDSVCPGGCDSQLFDSAIILREKRLDLEELLVEEKKVAETLKKDADYYIKKAKVMESQLKTALVDLEAFQVEKQGKLNELDVVVPLRFHQVELVCNVLPHDLSPCLIFTNSSLMALQRRIKELQHEKSQQRKYYKEARQQHVHLIKTRRIMEEKIKLLHEKCENMMMLKFGRVVDLEKLESVTINKTVEELKEQVRMKEEKHSAELQKRQKRIDRLKGKFCEIMRENTKLLEEMNVFISDKAKLEQVLDRRQRNMELEDNTLKNKLKLREQQRLVQLVHLQSQEIQALKDEIGLLSRKGGHILPPAQQVANESKTT